MRIGDQCIFVRYKRPIAPGARIFSPGDVLFVVKKDGDVTYWCHVITGDGQVVPWLRGIVYHEEYVPLRNGPIIANLPAAYRQ